MSGLGKPGGGHGAAGRVREHETFLGASCIAYKGAHVEATRWHQGERETEEGGGSEWRNGKKVSKERGDEHMKRREG